MPRHGGGLARVRATPIKIRLAPEPAGASAGDHSGAVDRRSLVSSTPRTRAAAAQATDREKAMTGRAAASVALRSSTSVGVHWLLVDSADEHRTRIGHDELGFGSALHHDKVDGIDRVRWVMGADGRPRAVRIHGIGTGLGVGALAAVEAGL